MTETEKNEIMSAIQAKLTGETLKDMEFLQEQTEHYAKQKDGAEIADEIVRLAMTRMPKENLDYMKQKIYIGERRLDEVYREAMNLSSQNLTAKSMVLTKQIYEHILKEYQETETSRFFCFRNLLESNLYYQFYHPTKNLLKAPFDFTKYIGLHAYNFIEVGQVAEAIPVLKDAIRYNPVNPDPRFELAEAYKLLHDDKKLLETIQETVPFCLSAYALSRCYANMGYYCVNLKDYESAVNFYFESLIFYQHPAIKGELQHISMLTGKPIQPPTRKKVLASFEKYEIHNGPTEEVIHTVTSMANQATEKQNWEEAVFYLRVITDITKGDPNVKKLLSECETKLQQQKNNGQAKEEKEHGTD